MDQSVTSWGSLGLPINDLPPCTCPAIWGGGGANPPCVNGHGKTLFLCVVFNKTNVVPPHLLASLFLQFEKFYVNIFLSFYILKFVWENNWRGPKKSTKSDCTKEHCNSSCSPAANRNSVQCKYWISFQLSRKYYL